MSCHFPYFKRRFQRPTLLCGELHRDARLPGDARNVCWGSDPSSTNLPKSSKPLTSWDDILGRKKKWDEKKMGLEKWSGTAGSNSGSNGGWNIMKHHERWWKNVRMAQFPIPIFLKNVFQVQNHETSSQVAFPIVVQHLVQLSQLRGIPQGLDHGADVAVLTFVTPLEMRVVLFEPQVRIWISGSEWQLRSS